MGELVPEDRVSEHLREFEPAPFPRAQGPHIAGGAWHVDVGRSTRPTIIAFPARHPALAATAVALPVLVGCVSVSGNPGTWAASIPLERPSGDAHG